MSQQYLALVLILFMFGLKMEHFSNKKLRQLKMLPQSYYICFRQQLNTVHCPISSSAPRLPLPRTVYFFAIDLKANC